MRTVCVSLIAVLGLAGLASWTLAPSDSERTALVTSNNRAHAAVPSTHESKINPGRPDSLPQRLSSYSVSEPKAIPSSHSVAPAHAEVSNSYATDYATASEKPAAIARANSDDVRAISPQRPPFPIGRSANGANRSAATSGPIIPVALAAELSSEPLDEATLASVREITDRFIEAVGEPPVGPLAEDSPFALRVRAAASEADQRFRLLHGDRAFVQMQMLAAREPAQP